MKTVTKVAMKVPGLALGFFVLFARLAVGEAPLKIWDLETLPGSDRIHCILPVDTTHCYVGTATKGLLRVDRETGAAIALPATLNLGAIRALARDGEDLLIAAEGGLARLKNQDSLQVLERDRHEQVVVAPGAWARIQAGTLKVHRGSRVQDHSPMFKSRLPLAEPFALVLDGEDVLYGANGALDLVVSDLMSHDYGLQVRNKSVRCAAGAPGGPILVGTEDGLLCLETGRDSYGRRHLKSYFRAPDGSWSGRPSEDVPTRVTAVACRGKDSFFVGLTGEGAGVLAGFPPALAPLALDGLEAILDSPAAPAQVAALAVRDDLLWIAAPGGLAVYRPSITPVTKDVTLLPSEPARKVPDLGFKDLSKQFEGGVSINFVNVNSLVSQPLAPQINGKPVPEEPVAWDEGIAGPAPAASPPSRVAPGPPRPPQASPDTDRPGTALPGIRALVLFLGYVLILAVFWIFRRSVPGMQTLMIGLSLKEPFRSEVLACYRSSHTLLKQIRRSPPLTQLFEPALDGLALLPQEACRLAELGKDHLSPGAAPALQEVARANLGRIGELNRLLQDALQAVLGFHSTGSFTPPGGWDSLVETLVAAQADILALRQSLSTSKAGPH